MKKKFCTKITKIIFQFKIITFYVYKKAREFYLKIKEYFDDQRFENFYVYFEQTWLNTDENEAVKIDLNLPSY